MCLLGVHFTHYITTCDLNEFFQAPFIVTTTPSLYSLHIKYTIGAYMTTSYKMFVTNCAICNI